VSFHSHWRLWRDDDVQNEVHDLRESRWIAPNSSTFDIGSKGKSRPKVQG